MAVIHRATENAILIVHALLELDAWKSTTEIADAVGIHRDTCRKALAEMKLHGWALHRELDGQDRWRVGLELADRSLELLARRVARVKELQAEVEGVAAGAQAVLERLG